VTLPVEAARLIEQVVRSAGLSPSQADRVRSDLEAHFHDGLDRRIPVRELIASFGEPGTVASLIRHTTRRTRYGWLSRYGLAAGIAVLAYGVALAQVASFPVSGPRSELDAELAAIAATVAGAEHSLRNRTEVEASFEIARDLTVAGTLWKRVAGVVLLEKTLRAGDSLLTAGAQQRLLALVRENLQSPVADEAGVAKAQMALALRLAGSQGRMDQDRLRLLRLAKGVGDRAWSAWLLEPIYFSRALDPAELHAIAAQLVLRRVAAAEQARQRLLHRLASSYGPALYAAQTAEIAP
jgi:hypothetical protein